MISNKKVSVIVVTYNAEKFIINTISSCLNQTYKNIEILILDNASSDNTVKIIESLKNERIRLFKNIENVGPYKGLNFLLEKAEGEYIAIQDHDDIWFPEKIEKQIKFMEENPEFIACGTNNYNFYEGSDILILNKKPFASAGKNYVPHSSLLFRNKNFRYDVNKILSDEYFEKKTLANAGKIFLIDEALTIHRIRTNSRNLSKTRFKLTFNNIKEFFDINGFGWKSFVYFISLIFLKVLSNKVRMIMEFKIFKRKNEKIKLDDFKNRFKNIKI